MLDIIIQFLSNLAPIVISEKDVVFQITKYFIDLAIIRFDGIIPHINLGTHWQKIEKKDLKIIIRNIISPEDRAKIKSSHIEEVIKRITDDISLKIDISGAFWKQQHLLNFQNCVINIINGEIINEHNKYIFNYVINANYVPSCRIEDAPNFMRFIVTSAGKENLECILRSTGYAISSLTDAKKGFFLTGPSNGGKSTYARFINSSVSPELISHVSFSQMTDSHYTMQYFGKRMNISFDNSPKPMDHEEVFKSVISCEEITGRELYESPVQFVPTLKLIYASNFPFNFKHPNEAIYRRMIIIPFENSIPPEKQDKKLIDKLIAERDIIFSLAVKSLKPLIESGYDFKMSPKGKAYLEIRTSALHSVEDFLAEKTVCDENSSISMYELYNNYAEWCRENTITPEKTTVFKDSVLASNPSILRRKVGPREKRLIGFKGLRLMTYAELIKKSD